MLPRMCFVSFDRLLHRRKKEDRGSINRGSADGRSLHGHPINCASKQRLSPADFDRPGAHKRDSIGRNEEEVKRINNIGSTRSNNKERRNRELMANRVANISDLIHRVTSSCLTHPLPRPRRGHNSMIQEEDEEDGELRASDQSEVGEGSLSLSTTSNLNNWEVEEEEEEEEKGASSLSSSSNSRKMLVAMKKLKETESLTSEVFEAISAMKRAYVRLQESHSPWDPERMRLADEAVVGELRILGRLRDRFRRVGGNGGVIPLSAVREVVGPYEAALEEVKRELKAKEAEIENLKEKLKRNCTTPTQRGSGRRVVGKMQYGKRVGCVSGLGTPLAAPTSELFEICMEEVKSTSKSFTAHLLSLMRAAHWDIAAAARSIIESTANNDTTTDHLTIPNVDPHHAKHALESYVTRKIFHGFENETFYIEGSLTSLLHPSEFRRDCFAQFRDMRSMDPGEILGILPTCQFGKFAGKKYLAIVHPKMEESLFGGLEQRHQVLAGVHPRTGFYGEYLRLAKAVWLLHLLAFALDPSPSHFEASKGAEFHPDYMESVVRLSTGGRAGGGWVVGFSVGPGFKLGNGSVVRARVFLVPGVRDM